MKVEMLKTTSFNGLKEAGKEYDIDDAVGKRWVERKLAKPASDFEELKVDGPAIVSYDTMAAKELLALCKERKISIDKDELKALTTDEDKKAYVIDKLKASDEAAEGGQE